MQQWLNYDEPITLKGATALVIRMAGEKKHNVQETRNEPMKIDRLSQTLNRATAALNRFNISSKPRSSFDPNTPHPIIQHPKWPRWASANRKLLRSRKEQGLCLLCGKGKHHWEECSKLRSPPPQPRSPSPTWSPRPLSPPKNVPSPR